MPTFIYNRVKAVEYANQWWNGANPNYPDFKNDDCTNFISQCLVAGDAPMTPPIDRYKGWWITNPQNSSANWSISWAVAGSLHWYLRTSKSGLRATRLERADQLQLGDVIQFDWTGDQKINHSTMVTAFNGNHQPLVNAHTRNVHHRYWDYRDSPAWTPQTKYYFFHIEDEFIV